MEVDYSKGENPVSKCQIGLFWDKRKVAPSLTGTKLCTILRSLVILLIGKKNKIVNLKDKLF